MTWVRIDDEAPNHPKLLAAGVDACWLWVRSLCWCNRYTTDGAIPKAALPAVAAGQWSPAKISKLAASLVTSGLWHDEGGSYRIHDYDVQQERALSEDAAAELQRRRERDAERKRMKRGMSADRSEDDVRRQSEESPQGPRSVPGNAYARDPVPSRPDPEPEREQSASAFDRALWAEWLAAIGNVTGAAPSYDGLAKCRAALPADVGEARAKLRAAADAYVRDCASRKPPAKPRFHFFAADIADWLAPTPTVSGVPGPVSPARRLLSPPREGAA
jgi:hypothetical protein